MAIERAMDLFAAEIGMDPAEVRRRNLVPRFLEGYTTGIGTYYDVGDYPEALRRALEPPATTSCGPSRPPAGPRAVPCSSASACRPTSRSPPAGRRSEYGSVELLDDGRIRVRTGATPYGQGHDTAWAMIVADRTGVPMDAIEVVHGDTDLVPVGGLTVGSRSVQLAGAAVADASPKLVDAARQEVGRAARGRGRRRGARPERRRASTWPARRPVGRTGPTLAAPRSPSRWPAVSDFNASIADVPLRRPRRRGRGRHRDGQGRACAATSPSTTPAGSSTRCSPRARSTAASPRASPRR